MYGFGMALFQDPTSKAGYDFRLEGVMPMVTPVGQAVRLVLRANRQGSNILTVDFTPDAFRAMMRNAEMALKMVDSMSKTA